MHALADVWPCEPKAQLLHNAIRHDEQMRNENLTGQKLNNLTKNRHTQTAQLNTYKQ
jgi:hypothetical protein